MFSDVCASSSTVDVPSPPKREFVIIRRKKKYIKRNRRIRGSLGNSSPQPQQQNTPSVSMFTGSTSINLVTTPFHTDVRRLDPTAEVGFDTSCETRAGGGVNDSGQWRSRISSGHYLSFTVSTEVLRSEGSGSPLFERFLWATSRTIVFCPPPLPHF